MTDDEIAAKLLGQVKYEAEVPGSQYPEHTWGGKTDLIEPLSTVLAAFEDPSGRANAAKALGYIGDEAALDPLTECIETDPDPEVRNAAAWGLRALGDPAAVSTLRAVVSGDADEDVRWQAARALAVIEWDGKPDYAATLIDTATDHTWDGFVHELGHDYVEDRDGVRRRLVSLLESEQSPDTLARVLRGLGAFEAETARIVPALDHGVPTVRVAAVEGLRGHEDAPVDRLFEVARTDPDPEVRAEAVDSAGHTAGDSGQTPRGELEGFLADEAGTVRAAAAHQLRFADPPANVPVLVRALEDPHGPVRARAAWGLKVASFPGAVPELLDAYADDDPEVRENVVRALQWIAGDSGRCDASGFSLLADETVPTVDGAETRPYDPGRARSVLRDAIRDPAARISGEATYALSSAGHPDAVAALADLATDGECAPELRNGGLRRLRYFPDSEVARDAYRTALTDDSPAIRSTAVEIAGAMEESEALGTTLETALDDDAPSVRQAAAEAARFADVEGIDTALRERLAHETDKETAFAIRKALGEFT